MTSSGNAFGDINKALEVFLPDDNSFKPPRILILELVTEYGRAIRREIELEDEVRRLGT